MGLRAANGLCVDYRPTIQPASNYYGAQPDVVSVACTVTDGHQWPQVDTADLRSLGAADAVSHPKGSDVASFAFTAPPAGYGCHVGRFMDHYPTGDAPELP